MIVMFLPMGVRDQLLAAVGESHLSDRQISLAATGTPDTIRNIRRGAAPRADTLEALCRVLGLDVQFSPRPEPDEGAGRSTEFSASRKLPVRRWADCSAEGYLLRPDESDLAPAPVGLRDHHAFYAQMRGGWMVPGGIGEGDYCLISPFARLEVDQRAWFLKRTGEQAIRWVMRLPAAMFDVGAWELDGLGHQKPVADQWGQGDVVDRGVVLAVYKDRPSVERPLRPAADWRPDAFAELWRSALFSSSQDLKAAIGELDKTVSAVEETEMRIKRLAGQGALSESERDQLLRVLEERLQNSIQLIRSSVAENPAAGDRGTPDGGV